MKRLFDSLVGPFAVIAVTLSLAVCSPAQTVLYSFPGSYPGGSPMGTLVFDPAGNIYGVTLYGGPNPSFCAMPGATCGTVFELSPNGSGGWTYKTLHSFTGDANGGSPWGGLVRDAAGNLYGTTGQGGNLTKCVGSTYVGQGCGVVFKLSPTASGHWQESVIYTFNGGADGGNPVTDLIMDAAGNLYGTTQFGGSASACNGMGCGVVFRLSHNAMGWHESVLHSFNFKVDGEDPRNVSFDAAGNLYGMTFQGGSNISCGRCGTVWRLSPTASGPWNETILYAFQGGTDGAFPVGGLVTDAGGNLYGTTSSGGSNNAGTVFELSPTTSGFWNETLLHSFAGVNNGDGSAPERTMVFDSFGDLYGTTAYGGSNAFCNIGCGTLFTLSPNGDGTWSYFGFPFESSNGAFPNNVIFGPDGNLYGSTTSGGNVGYGVIFQQTPF